MSKRDTAIRAMEETIREIAAYNDYPPPPGNYAGIKIAWRRMVRAARKAVAKLDALTSEDL